MATTIEVPPGNTNEPVGELDGQIAQMATNVGRKFDLKNLNFKLLLLERWRSMKSWGGFFDTSKMHCPVSALQWSRRLLRNLEHFQSNYMCIVFILVIYCILTSPLLLIVLAACFGAMYYAKLRNNDSPLTIAGRRVSLYHQYLVIGVLSVPLLMLAGAPSLLFWIIGASFFVVGLHATVYAIEILDTVGDDFMIPPTQVIASSPVQDL
ncbi:Prenylated Rab acceptor protein 1 [Fragariocoptes setiger]|uniref:PRA1 family protein n=1 Tax=Fragariocoptes setiger TaxID=1670756 RepID=A0ABQ7S5Z7_9ACAR|nr:Prenylated Rab acceptor protein 1 [Fragariocoptes setiger]